MPFHYMHQARRHQGRAKQDDEATEEGSSLPLQRLEQRAHAWRIANEFQKPHDAEYHQNAQVRWYDECEPEGQNCEQVHDAHGAGDEFQARAASAEMAGWSVLGRNPYPQQVFDGESNQRDDLQGREPGSKAGLQVRD